MKCIISGSKKFKKLFSIPKIGIFMRTERIMHHNPKKKQINYFINKDTGTVQISPKINPAILYKKDHGSGTVGVTWKKHHSIFFQICKKYIRGNILEIGGGNNSLLKNKELSLDKINKFYSLGKNINIVKTSNKLKKFNNFFSEKLLRQKKIFNVDLVIHSHLFEHIFFPDQFLKSIHSILNDSGVHIFSIPNMKKMIKSGMPNAVFFEHPYYYDENIIKILLERNGFKTIKKFYFGKRHSIIYVTKKIKTKKNRQYSSYKKNERIFLEYKRILKKNVSRILKAHKQGKKIYLFGAHIFSQIILAYIPNKIIQGIVDNDKKKQNKFLYGTTIKVFSLDKLKKISNVCLYLNAGDYEKEITNQVLKINKKCLII